MAREHEAAEAVVWPTPRSVSFYGRAGFGAEAAPLGMDLAGTDSAPAQRVEQRAELALGLVELGLGLRVGDDAGAREQLAPSNRVISAQRSAIAHSPSPFASIQPTGPA